MMTPARLEEVRRQLGVGTLWDSATVRELLDYIGELQRGGAVVVPDMPEIERAAILSMAREAYTRNGDTELVCEQVIGDTLGWVKARAKAIPADRVLGDGMVGVDREEWEALNQIASSVTLPPKGCARILDVDWVEAANGRRNLDALRSAKGEVEG